MRNLRKRNRNLRHYTKLSIVNFQLSIDTVMNYIKQILIILAFTLVGEVLQYVIPLPVPAAIYGFVLLFLALCTGLLKEEHIADTADFLIRIMGVLFVAPAVNLLSYFDLIAENWVSITTIVLVSTVCVFAVAGLVTQALTRKGGSKNG